MNHPTQSEFEAALIADGFTFSEARAAQLEIERSDARYAERRDSEQERPLGVPRG